MTNPEANHLPFMHIDIDQGTPYVCFCSGSGIMVRKLSGQSWETTCPDILIPHNYFEFRLSNGTPYIAYLQETYFLVHLLKMVKPEALNL